MPQEKKCNYRHKIEINKTVMTFYNMILYTENPKLSPEKY